MKQKNWFIKTLVFSLAGLMIAGTLVFAGQGKGPGGGKMPADCPMSGASTNVTPEQVQKLNAERTAFLAATQDLRQQIQEKEAALTAEMTKKSPDLATATAIQKEISALEAAFDEKRIAHMIEMKKIDPYAGAGMMGMRNRMSGKHGRGQFMGMERLMNMSQPAAETTPEATN